jgi:hypothetical protein
MKHPIYSLFSLGLIILTSATLAPAQEAAPSKGPPLPFHTIEGVGGGAITPLAYLVNPAPKGQPLGLPAVAFDAISLGEKNLLAFMLTENLFGRVELGYGADRLYLGGLPDAIKNATGVDINRDDVWLHSFDVRVLALPEGSFNSPLPALTVGGQFKFNQGIHQINHSLGGALNGIGYHREWGGDFTVTATKMFTQLGQPVIITAGARESQAANLGFLGFSNDWNATFEGSAIYLPASWALVAYEFRQKTDPYKKIPGLINGEDSWHGFDASWIINSHATLVGGYGIFGNLANSKADNAWWLQVKYEI